MTLLQRVESRVSNRVLSASEGVVRATTRDRPVVDGVALDRRTHFMFKVGRLAERAIWKMHVDDARAYYARLNRALEAPPPELGSTRELSVPMRSGARPARAYYPPLKGEAEMPLPGLLYFHGGGFTIGSIETHDVLCRRICAASGAVVVSVDYRLAPEHPFPAAAEDGVDAYHWVRDAAEEIGIEDQRIAVGGDSAGGNIAAVISAVARDEGHPPPAAQLLIYPAVAWNDHPGRAKPELQYGYGLDTDVLSWFWDQYVPEGQTRDPAVAPLLLDSHAELPPAIVVTAGFDLLCGEGIDYARALDRAGVPVVHHHAPDLPHGFCTMSVLPRAREVIEAFSGALRERIGG